MGAPSNDSLLAAPIGAWCLRRGLGRRKIADLRSQEITRHEEHVEEGTRWHGTHHAATLSHALLRLLALALLSLRFQ